jgi:hypothetical protein
MRIEYDDIFVRLSMIVIKMMELIVVTKILIDIIIVTLECYLVYEEDIVGQIMMGKVFITVLQMKIILDIIVLLYIIVLNEINE